MCSLLPRLLLTGGILILVACPEEPRSTRKAAQPRATQKTAQHPSSSKPPSLELLWDPKTGKGDVRHRLSSGDWLRTCFHCGYPGYTGGLVVGSYNGSGMGFYPQRPIRGHRRINVFCAQDESIWDRRQNVEYSYGWSENFGASDDGKRLEYIRGRVLDRGPRRLILQSENAGGCYRVTKVAYTRLDVRWWIIATRIHNRCSRPVHLDFFTGDDPWIGLYRSSDGDVGWTDQGLIREETFLGPGRFTAGGLYDLGNRALGQKEGSFSGQANFIQLDPAIPLPDISAFANSFAHRKQEIDPARPLDNTSLTALNLGWTDRRLDPGEGLTVAFALGLAHTTSPTALPRLPAITADDWSVWRRFLKEGRAPASAEVVEFAAERVELTLTRQDLRVDGTYHLRNRGQSSATTRIDFPVLTSRRRPPPGFITVDGKRVPLQGKTKERVSGQFSVSIPARGLSSFRVAYNQRHQGRRAVYMVTSARRWPAPITRAVFVVKHPASWQRVTLSYPTSQIQRTDEEVARWVVLQPFLPDRELEIRW